MGLTDAYRCLYLFSIRSTDTEYAMLSCCFDMLPDGDGAVVESCLVSLGPFLKGLIPAVGDKVSSPL